MILEIRQDVTSMLTFPSFKAYLSSSQGRHRPGVRRPRQLPSGRLFILMMMIMLDLWVGDHEYETSDCDLWGG